jgi:hypothetical protein
LLLFIHLFKFFQDPQVSPGAIVMTS